MPLSLQQLAGEHSCHCTCHLYTVCACTITQCASGKKKCGPLLQSVKQNIAFGESKIISHGCGSYYRFRASRFAGAYSVMLNAPTLQTGHARKRANLCSKMALLCCYKAATGDQAGWPTDHSLKENYKAGPTH